MKKFVAMGIAALFVLVLSSTGFASVEVTRYVHRIVSTQPLMDQDMIFGNPKEWIPVSKDNKYRYYKVNSSDKYKLRISLKTDRIEVEISDAEEQWKLARIRYKKSGVIANYINGRLKEYTRKLNDDILAHYQIRKTAESDRSGQNADFYTKFTDDAVYTYYFDTLDHAREVSDRICYLRVFSDGERYQVEVRNFSGKWSVSMLINPEKGVISNYKDRRLISKSRLTSDGRIVAYSDQKQDDLG